jgi:hypothetical protein
MTPRMGTTTPAPSAAHVQQDKGIDATDLSAAPSRFVPTSIDEVLKTARMFYDGGLMPKHFYEDKRVPADSRRPSGIAGIATMILYGAELGLSPSQAMRMMHVVEGRAVLASSGMVALIKRSPKCVYFRVEESSDEHCTVETVRRLDDGKSDKARRMTVKIWWGDAKDIPPPAKDLVYVEPSRTRDGAVSPAWQRYPSRMLKARACSWVANDVYEDVIAGLYSAEEIVDYRDNRSQNAIVDNIFDMVAPTPAAVAGAGTVPRFESEPDEAPPPATAPETAPVASDPIAEAAALADQVKALHVRIEALGPGMVEEIEAIDGAVRALPECGERRGLWRAFKAKVAIVRGEGGGA